MNVDLIKVVSVVINIVLRVIVCEFMESIFLLVEGR